MSSFSSSHHIVLTSSPDGPIIAYDISSGTTIARFTGSRSPRHGLALAGKSFIAASHISSSATSGSIHLYNWWSSTALHHLPLPEPVAPIVATKDGSYLFAGGLSGNIYSLSLPSGDVVKSFSAHEKPVSCLKISHDGSLLITGSDDGAIVVVPIFLLVDASMDVDNSNTLLFQRFAAHNASVTDIIGLFNSSMLSCSTDCTCKLWTLTGSQLHTFTFPCAILGVALDPMETEFYAAGSDGLIYKATMKVKTKQEISQRQKLVTTFSEKHSGTVVYVVMVNNGKHLVSASEDGSVFVWQVERGNVILVLGNDTTSISSLVVAVNGIGDGNSGCGGGGGGGSDGGGLSGRDMVSKSIKETIEVEDVLSEVGEDRSRAIDMLESAIGMYEKLFELILKEAMKGSNSNTSEKDKD